MQTRLRGQGKVLGGLEILRNSPLKLRIYGKRKALEKAGGGLASIQKNP